MDKKKCLGSVLIYVPVCVLLILLLSVSAGAASGKKGWTTEGNYDYYYNAKGNKASGLQEIKGKQYYFDRNTDSLVVQSLILYRKHKINYY